MDGNVTGGHTKVTQVGSVREWASGVSPPTHYIAKNSPVILGCSCKGDTAFCGKITGTMGGIK